MTASLQVKNGKFYVVINSYENGKRKQTWVATHLPEKGNKRKAEQMRLDVLREYEQKAGLIRSDVTFADYVRYWLQQAKRRVDEVTYQGYETLAVGHILPYFDKSGIKLQDITRAHLQAYIDEKAANGRKDGKGGLSARSLHLHKNILNQTLTEAVRNELLTGNPCQYVDLPTSERFQASYYTATQLQTLMDAIEGEPIAPLVKIDIFYGLRRSEILGLKWDCIDFERRTVTIKHTVSKVTKVVAKDKTKNNSSRRSFPLLQGACEIFLQLKAEEEEKRKLMGKAYHDNDYVFKWPDGHPFSPDYVSKRFAKLLAKYELPHIRFHELRHSCASFLINSGYTLKDVQEWMGHSDIKMTADIYGHLDVSRKHGMAGSISNLFD